MSEVSIDGTRRRPRIAATSHVRETPHLNLSAASPHNRAGEAP